MSKTYKYELTPLPYAYDALEPYIDRATMGFHHDRHVQTYTDNLNKALDNVPQFHSWSLEKLLKHPEEIPESVRNAVRNNAGGVFNHDLFFASMRPNPRPAPGGDLAKAVDESFGDFGEFKAKFRAAALGVFGSGWAWFVLHPKDGLKILATPNQDTVLHLGVQPLLAVDVWEHAYYLNYQNRRADYLDNWFWVVDWEKVEERYREFRAQA